MRLLSQIFQPLITIPKNAKIKSTEITCKSQKLLTECGFIRPTSSGMYAILPLARRALDKLESRINYHLQQAGGQRVSLPALTPSPLWAATGRLEGGNAELLALKDRHGKEYLLAPTYEEAITDLLSDVGPLSYKQLPLLLYQITNKYRDELRPKHGLLRAREFTMMDAYGVHASPDCAKEVYARVTDAYTNIFKDLNVDVYRVQAPSGEMGGSLSHEWQLPSPAGEDRLSLCGNCRGETRAEGGKCSLCGGRVEERSSIEVGHTFMLDTKYSQPLNCNAVTADGTQRPVLMSCYGIGVTRLMAACVDSLSSDTSLRWPERIAPYSLIIIGPKEGSKEWSAHGWESLVTVHGTLSTVYRDDIVIDDRHGMTIGKRMMQAERSGYPNIVVCGRATIETPPKYELKRGSDVKLCTLDELVHIVQNNNKLIVE